MPVVTGKPSSGNKGGVDGEDDDDDEAQIVAEEEFVATNFTGTGGGEGNPEYSFRLRPAAPITMAAIEMEEEFGTEMEEEIGTEVEEESEGLKEVHEHENYKHIEHESEAEETKKHPDVMASYQEINSHDHGDREEISNEDAENDGRVSHSSKHSDAIEHEAGANTTEHMTPRDENNDNDEGEKSEADIEKEGEEEAEVAENMPDSNREEEEEIAADNNQDEDKEMDEDEEVKSETEDGKNMEE